MSSQKFEDLEDELKTLHDDISAKITQKIPKLTREMRKSTVREVNKKIEDANLKIEEMDEEAGSALGVYRNSMMSKIRGYRRDFDQLRKDLAKPGGQVNVTFGRHELLETAEMAAVHMPDLDAAERKGHTSEEYAKAVKQTNTSDEEPFRKFDKTQSLQYLGEENDRVSVPIWIASYGNSSTEFEKVAPSWFEHIGRAIKDINYAVPGLNLHTVSEKSKAIIKIARNQEKSCFTRGSILSSGSAEIYLSSNWKNQKRTSCHELLHALGFGHEHQRPDRDYSIEVGSDSSQYKKLDDLYGVTRFDPYSIMLYKELKKYVRSSSDPVWFTKPSHELNTEMSELDKVGLNNLYRPCKRAGYSPVIGSSGLFYCGRYFGAQYPGHDGGCGPDYGVNCPACRVLKTDTMDSLWKNGLWQGWTGAIYCGNYFEDEGHDGHCGPDNGPACPECVDKLLHEISEHLSADNELDTGFARALNVLERPEFQNKNSRP